MKLSFLKRSCGRVLRNLPFLKADINSFSRAGESFPQTLVKTSFIDEKLKLISDIGTAKSIRDFGGLYIVHGKYLLDSAVSLGCEFASMVDVTPLAEWEVAKDLAVKKSSQLQVEFVHADFRDPNIYKDLKPVEVSILYEVLLHQDNYMEVIRNVLNTTEKYVCVAQPCLKESFFSLPAGAVLLQFYDKKLKDILRDGSFWPESEQQLTNFQTHSWMWGHTTSHLIEAFYGYGWEVDFGVNLDKLCGPSWDYPLIRFRKRTK